MATSGGRSGRPWGRSSVDAGVTRSAGLRSGVLLALGFLALPLHGRLLGVLAAASLREDAALLDLLVEAAQGAFERLVLSHSDFSQSVFTSFDLGLVALTSGARPTGLDVCSTDGPPEPPESTRGPRVGQTFGRQSSDVT